MKMNNRIAAALKIALFCALALTASSRAWFGMGHMRSAARTLAAVEGQMPAFFIEGRDMICHFSTEPDLFTVYAGPKDLYKGEIGNHYFHVEMVNLAELPDNREDFLLWAGQKGLKIREVGTAPYAVIETAGKLSLAFAEYRQWPENPAVRFKCLYYAGVLAHYAQDVCMPLHTTKHYDGRQDDPNTPPKKGIHRKIDALFSQVNDDALADLDLAELKPVTDLHAAVIDALRASHAHVDTAYALQDLLPENSDIPADDIHPRVNNFTRERFTHSVCFTARLFLYAWHASEKIKLPRWIAEEISHASR